MIYVTQGHERGIGLEVFLKSLVSSPELCLQSTLVTTISSIEKTCQALPFTFEINKNQNQLLWNDLEIPLRIVHSTKLSPSLVAILDAIDSIDSKNDILFTLPTSKDQLVYKNINFAGHTEFLRHFFNNNHLVMSFWGPTHNQALITDHIPLKDISSTITEEYFTNKMNIILQYLKDYTSVQKVIIAGINPHAGENGILGDDELKLTPVLNSLKKRFSFDISEFLSGDTLHSYESENTFFIYMYHDQGLARFKTENKFLGINATLGMPFLRASVDHGTAFNLFGHNLADSSGCHYALNFVSEMLHAK